VNEGKGEAEADAEEQRVATSEVSFRVGKVRCDDNDANDPGSADRIAVSPISSSLDTKECGFERH
jgi:hypothetical protein